MRVLVTGGSGYIGRHVVRDLGLWGHEVLNVDLVKPVTLMYHETFEKVDIRKSLDICDNYDIDAVIHLAALIDGAESISRPDQYHRTNVIGTVNVLDYMGRNNIPTIIFASSAAVYSESGIVCTEDSPVHPKNPYGVSKHIGERLIEDYYHAGLVKGAVALRFFNVVGIDTDIAQPSKAMNLVKIITDSVEQDKCMTVFGDSHKTKDGYAVRDFIHVTDVAKGVISSLDACIDSDEFSVYNIGTGVGYSVRDLIREAGLVHNKRVQYTLAGIREGEVSKSIAYIGKIQDAMGWKPTSSQDLGRIFKEERHAYRIKNTDK